MVIAILMMTFSVVCSAASVSPMVSRSSGGGGGGGGGDGRDSSSTVDGVKALNNVSLAATNIGNQLEPLLAVPWQTLVSGLRDDERAKLNVTLAYTVNSLYYMFLRTKGVDTKTHKVRGELERIKGYMTKLQVVKAKEPPKPTMRIDQAAAHRMVVAGLTGESAEAAVETGGKQEGGRQAVAAGASSSGGGSSQGRRHQTTPPGGVGKRKQSGQGDSDGKKTKR